jgi:WD40 repeat protein
MQVLAGHRDGIVGMAQDERFLYTGSKDKTFRVWDKARLSCVQAVSGFPCGVKVIPDSGVLYAITAHGTKNKLFSVWEKEGFTMITEFALPADSDLQGIVQDERTVYVTARDGKIFLIDKQTLDIRAMLRQNEAGIWGLAVDENHLYTASVDQTITIWDKQSLQPARRLEGHKANIQSIAVDERYLYSISTDKTALVWDKAGGAIVWRFTKLFRTGLLGLSCTETHLLLLNWSEGMKAVKKGEWGGEMTGFSEIRSNNVIVDAANCYAALRNGKIMVYRRDQLGI